MKYIPIITFFFTLLLLLSNSDGNFAYDPSGCTAVTALVTPDNRIFVVCVSYIYKYVF